MISAAAFFGIYGSDGTHSRNRQLSVDVGSVCRVCIRSLFNDFQYRLHNFTVMRSLAENSECVHGFHEFAGAAFGFDQMFPLVEGFAFEDRFGAGGLLGWLHSDVRCSASLLSDQHRLHLVSERSSDDSIAFSELIDDLGTTWMIVSILPRELLLRILQIGQSFGEVPHSVDAGGRIRLVERDHG